MKKIDKLLLKILVLSTAILVLSTVLAPSRKNAPKSTDSTILNPKYKDRIKKITITKTEGNLQTSIEIARHGNFYIASNPSSKTSTTADSKIINTLIENTINIRRLYKISDTRDKSSLFFSGSSPYFSINFTDNEGFTLTNVNLSSENAFGGKIYLNPVNQPSVYETENNLDQFLTTDINYWAKGELFPEIETPVQIIFETLSQSSPSLTVNLNEKSSGFSEKSKKLMSFRHGIILNQENFTLATKKIKSRLTVHDGNGRIAQIEFFDTASENEQEKNEFSCFYRKTVTPSQIDSQETSFIFYSENAIYEISNWTYGNICSNLLENQAQ